MSQLYELRLIEKVLQCNKFGGVMYGMVSNKNWSFQTVIKRLEVHF